MEHTEVFGLDGLAATSLGVTASLETASWWDTDCSMQRMDACEHSAGQSLRERTQCLCCSAASVVQSWTLRAVPKAALCTA